MSTWEEGTLPNAIVAEKAVLAAALVDPACVAQIVALIEPADFISERHRAIMRGIDGLHFDGAPIDAAALVEKCKEQKELINGLGSYIAGLLGFPVATNLEHHCGLIRQAARDREVLAAMSAAVSAGGDPTRFKTAMEAVREVLQTRFENPTDSRNRFTFTHIGSIELTAPEWLVAGIAETDSLMDVFGDPSTGKSILAVDLACCVASGQDFFGYQVQKKGPVIYIAGEGRKGLCRRFLAWGIRHGVNYKTLPIFMSSMPAMLCDQQSVVMVENEIAAIAKRSADPVLIVIDTLARNFGPGDENSTKDMTAFVAGCDRLRALYGSTVLIVHHSGHGDKTRARGSMALKGAVDVEYRLEKDADGVVCMTIGKPPKDFQPPDPMAFVIRSVDLGISDMGGEPVTAPIFDQIDYEPGADITTPVQRRSLGKNQGIAMRELHRLFDEHRQRLEAAGYDPDNARVTVSDWAAACREAGIDRRKFYDTRATLIRTRLIAVDQAGYVSTV